MACRVVVIQDLRSGPPSLALRRDSLHSALRLNEDWWRWRESNSRPKRESMPVYIRSLICLHSVLRNQTKYTER